MEMKPLSLREEVQSPLAAMRSALNLIAMCSDDERVANYVRLAEQQVREIATAVNHHSVVVCKAKAA